MHYSQFLIGLGALISASNAAPTSGSLVPTLLPRDGPGVPKDDECNYPWLASQQADGVPWGESKPQDKYFCAAKGGLGQVITGMKIWADDTRVNGVQVWYDDGSHSDIFGRISVKPTQSDNELHWDSGSKITMLRTWRSRDGGALGKIRVEVEGKVLEVGGQDKNKNNVGTEMPVYSGKLVAFRGMINDGNDVMTAEFRFLPSEPTSLEVTDMQFKENLDDWNLGKKGIETIDLQEVYIINSNPEGPGNNKTYRFSNSATKSNSVKNEQGSDKAFGFKIGTKVEWGIKVPLVLESKAELNGEINFLYTKKDLNSQETKQENMMRWDESGAILPGKAVHCKASTKTGKFNSDYTGSYKALLDDGHIVLYSQVGHFESIGWSQAWSNCQQMDAKDVPKDGPVAVKEGDSK